MDRTLNSLTRCGLLELGPLEFLLEVYHDLLQDLLEAAAPVLTDSAQVALYSTSINVHPMRPKAPPQAMDARAALYLDYYIDIS